MADEQKLMADEPALRRPVGWWLKEADARLEAAFEARLRDRNVTRREWQVLASVARAPVARTRLVAELAAFDPPEAVAGYLDRLVHRGWLAGESDLLHLTPDGWEVQQALAAEVDRVRRLVATALPGEDYVTLIRLLARLVEALPRLPEPQ